jgi:hypothetical protein
MHFNHLGLPVRDERRSQQFYSAYFGFDPAAAQKCPDGTVVIRNEAAYAAFKCLDPDGHRIEVYWEPPAWPVVSGWSHESSAGTATDRDRQRRTR